jgi:glucosylceramidase
MSPPARLSFALRVLLCVGIITAVLLIVVLVSQSMSRAGGTTAGTSVNVWLTTSDGSNQLTAQPGLTFISDSQNSASSTIDVNEGQQFQQMDGFGAAVTDSSAWLMYTRMSTGQRNELMKRLFDPVNGIGISFVRIPMGASDFSVNGPYSYDDLPPGQTDPTLSKFSINHDMAYIIPILKQALALNPSLKFMANPWSPPAWMKTNGSMFGTSNGHIGTLIPSDYGPLAQYFVKFIQAYQAQGIPIYAITPQNEPGYAPDNYPGMFFSAGDESNFIKNYLSPALNAANLHPRIIPYDHNWDDPNYAKTLLSDPVTNSDIAGISWHCYAGSPTVMSTIHTLYPTKDVYETECATGASVTPIDTIDLLMQSVQNWAKTVELWNIALDANHGPHNGGCPDCLGVVTANPDTGNGIYSHDYYLIGQFSKFVVPGAYHIGANTLGRLTDVAFKNPDGSKVVVAYNNDFHSRTLKVRWNGSQSFTYTLPVGAVVTFKWA